MARRRSRNRRASRKSLNITELDEDSELIDSHDPLWWKNMEADITRRSQRLSYSDTTATILDETSFVNASEVRDDWWKALGRPSMDPSRVSSRGRIRTTDTRKESSDSEESDGSVTRKKRSRGEESTDNVAIVPREPTIIPDSQEVGSPKTQEASRLRSPPPQETSVVSAGGAERRSRPKPFKKRFAKITDGDIDEFANEEEANAVDSSRQTRERDASLSETRPSSNLSRINEAEAAEAAGPRTVMGAPRSAMRRKRRPSSLARRFETSSEESGADNELTKRQSRVARKMRKTVSMDPLDRATTKATETVDMSVTTNQNIERVQREATRMGKNSTGRRIEDGSSDRDENLQQAPGTKTLRVLVSRVSPKKYGSEESSRMDESANEPGLRASRRRFIEDSAYELPDQERSASLQISDSDDIAAKQSPLISMQTPTGAPNKNLAASSRKSLALANYSRTKIFSDEDISLEDLSYVEKRKNLLMQQIEKSPVLEKDAYGSIRKDRSVERSGRGESRSSRGRRVNATRSRLSEETDASSNGPEVSHKSRTIASRQSESKKLRDRFEETFDKEGIKETGEIDGDPEKSDHARSRVNVELFERAPTSPQARNEPRENTEPSDDLRNVQSESLYTRSKKKSPKSPGLRRSPRINESPVEPEVTARTASANLSRILGDSRLSEQNLTAGVSQRAVPFDEDRSSENEEQIVERSHRRPASRNISEKSVSVKSALEKSPVEKSVAGTSVSEKLITDDRFSKSTTRPDSRRGLILWDANTSASAEAAGKPEKGSNSRTKDVSIKSLVDESRDRQLPPNDRERQISPKERQRRSPVRSFPVNELHPDSHHAEEIQPEDPKVPDSPRMRNLRGSSKGYNHRHESPNTSRSAQERESRNLVIFRRSIGANESEINESIAEDEGAQLFNRSPKKTGEKSVLVARASKNILTPSGLSNVREGSVARENWNVVSSTPNVTSTVPRVSTVATLKASTPAGRARHSTAKFHPSKFLQKSPEPTEPRETAPRFDPMKMKEVMKKVEELKSRNLEAMRLETLRDENSKKLARDATRKVFRAKPSREPTKKPINKAYIVDGKVYKRPKLPRPKPWATDRLYRHLWKRMEPKFGSSTRVKSEELVVFLAQVVALAIKRKKYESYKSEVDALMKEMAKLRIVRTPNDFYDFCYEFMPYEFRVKVTPILLPGNEVTIPYDPKKLHTPILADE